MENQEVYHIEPGVKELVITHRQGIDEKEPIKLKLSGNIDTPRRWIEKRHVQNETDFRGNFVAPFDSYIEVDRDHMNITLHVHETDPLNNSFISGNLSLHSDFSKWNINTGRSWEHKQLSEFIKMNRSCFASKSEAMKLSAELADIKIKADNEFEKADDNRGTVRTSISQRIIESNIPKSFKLNIPIFKGTEKIEFEIEVYVSPSDYSVVLVSPDANDIVSDIKNSLIDKEIAAIEKIAPNIVIVEV